MRLLTTVLATTILAGGAAAAQTAPRLSEIIRSLEDRGYVVTDVDVDSTEIEIEARDAQGRKVEIDVDPLTGAVRREKLDD